MKNIYSRVIFTIFIAAIFSTLYGCIHLRAPSIEQKQYSLSVTTSNYATKNSNAAILEVYYPKTAAQYSNQSFVYRLNKYNFTTDAYNVFFALPADEIHQITINYLRGSGLFKYVAAETFPTRADYALRIDINKLYADYTDKINPKGVIEIRYVLFDLAGSRKILLDKTYEENIPLAEKSSEALIKSWDIGLAKILHKLHANLQRLNLVATPISPLPPASKQNIKQKQIS